jgi:hypothetical protein
MTQRPLVQTTWLESDSGVVWVGRRILQANNRLEKGHDPHATIREKTRPDQ